MYNYVALCAVGAEKILGNELKQMGYRLEGSTPGRVAFCGDADTVYRANYCLRTSDRLYIQMAKYRAENFDDLFDGCYAVNWQDFFYKDIKLVGIIGQKLVKGKITEDAEEESLQYITWTPLASIKLKNETGVEISTFKLEPEHGDAGYDYSIASDNEN